MTAMAQRATARGDTTTTTMATGDDDNDVDGVSAMGSEVDDDVGMTGDDNDDNDDGDDEDDVDGRRRRRPKTTTMATAQWATRSKMMATARRATARQRS